MVWNLYDDENDGSMVSNPFNLGAFGTFDGGEIESSFFFYSFLMFHFKYTYPS